MENLTLLEKAYLHEVKWSASEYLNTELTEEEALEVMETVLNNDYLNSERNSAIEEAIDKLRREENV